MICITTFIFITMTPPKDPSFHGQDIFLLHPALISSRTRTRTNNTHKKPTTTTTTTKKKKKTTGHTEALYAVAAYLHDKSKGRPGRVTTAMIYTCPAHHHQKKSWQSAALGSFRIA